MSSTVLMGAGAAAYAERELCVSEATDGALVAAVREGDDRAFEQLFERYQRRVAAYVYGMVGDHGRAEDITQEIFMSALRRMRETERPIAFRPWIYEIAKNACIDQFRRSRRTEEVSFDSAEELGAADYGRLVGRGPSPDALVDQKQALNDLTGAFGGLSETHHRILVLRELEGLSYREIGDELDMTRASVESTLFRARRRLTEEYDDLASGRRCRRVQELLGSAAAGDLGAREARRFARHVSHCQPCRLQARVAGVDGAVMARRPRRTVGARIAGLLPFPALWRHEWTAMGPAAEPVVAWSKVAAAAATVALAGVGAGVGSQVAPSSERPDRDAAATPAAERAAGRSAAPSSARPLPRPGGEQAGRAAAAPKRRPGSAAPSTSRSERLGGGAPGAALEPAGARKPEPAGPRGKRPAANAPAPGPAAPAPSAPAPGPADTVTPAPAAPASPAVPGDAASSLPKTSSGTGGGSGGGSGGGQGSLIPSVPSTPGAPGTSVPASGPPAGAPDLSAVTGAVAGAAAATGAGSGVADAMVDFGL